MSQEPTSTQEGVANVCEISILTKLSIHLMLESTGELELPSYL